MGRNVLKFSIGALALVALAVGVLYLTRYIRCKQNPTCQAEKYFSELEKRYAEDTYGGSTPEETLQLFIDALKKGDIELASRYFVVDRQEDKFMYLNTIKMGNKLEILVKELSYPYEKRVFGANDNSHYVLDIYNSQDNTHIQFDVVKGPRGVWKIVSL